MKFILKAIVIFKFSYTVDYHILTQGHATCSLHYPPQQNMIHYQNT